MDLSMTKVEALNVVNQYVDEADWMPDEQHEAIFVARELCFIDIIANDIEEWFSWTTEHITNMFYDLALTSIEDFAESIEAEDVSNALLKETLGIESEPTDRQSASLGIKKGAAGLFIALGAYIAIREQVKRKYYED